MKISEIDLREMLSFEPEQGRLLLGGERMLLFRQDALAVLRRLLYEQVGEQLARTILSRFGHRCGYGDYETLIKNFNWETEEDRLRAGPAMHAWEGIAQVDMVHVNYDRNKGKFFMRGNLHNSYEAEIHRELFGPSETPICHSLTGYASGWCSAFFGKPVLAIETKCAGKGDPHCELEIRTKKDWGREADAWQEAFDQTDYSITRDLEAKIAVIQEQELAISELNTPVMEIWDDVLVLPIVGVVDTRRSMEIMNNLLSSIEQNQARCVIIDVTGVEVVDTKTADYLLKVMRAATLLGSRCVLTGLSSAIAQTLVEIGADLSEIRTLRNIKEGLKDCLKYLRSQRQA